MTAGLRLSFGEAGYVTASVPPSEGGNARLLKPTQLKPTQRGRPNAPCLVFRSIQRRAVMTGEATFRLATWERRQLALSKRANRASRIDSHDLLLFERNG